MDLTDDSFRVRTRIVQLCLYDFHAEVEFVHDTQLFSLPFDRTNILDEIQEMVRALVRKEEISLLLLDAPPMILQVGNIPPPPAKIYH